MVGKLTDDKKMSASRLPALFGASPYNTKNEELRYSLDAIMGTLIALEQNEFMFWGDRLEPIVAFEAAKVLGLTELQTDIPEAVVHSSLPMQCSLDALGEGDGRTIKNGDIENVVVVGADEIALEGIGVLEIKTTNGRPEDELPLHRGPLQLQGQLMCTDLKWGAVAVLYGGNQLRVFLFHRHEKTIEAIEREVLDFERRLHEDPVDWYAIEHELDPITIFPSGELETPVILNDNIEKLLDSYDLAKQTIQDCEGIIKDVTLAVQAHLGNHTEGHTSKHHVKWPMKNFKAKPEKITPAKKAYSVRQKTINVKKREKAA